MLYREITAVCSEMSTKHIIHCVGFYVTSGGTKRYIFMYVPCIFVYYLFVPTNARVY